MASANSTKKADGIKPKDPRAVVLLSEIARLASTADRMCFYGPNQGKNSSADEYELHIDLLRELINRIGYSADLALALSGEEQVQGDAEAWLLPPSYTDQARQIHFGEVSHG